MTAKIYQFLAEQQPATPCLIVDLDVIADNYAALNRYLPTAKVFYAVKANPGKEVIELLAGLGSCFDTASRPEIESVLAAGVSPDRISFGNTIKKERDIAWAFQQGIELFAFDSEAELDKLARVAPGAKVFCRLLMTCDGAEWPLSRKFGCEAEMARDLLVRARDLGLEPYGISFHVGSQQTRLDQWDIAIGKTAMLFSELNEAGIELKMINLGGGLPAHYRDEVAPVDDYSNAIMNAMTKHFGNDLPLMIVEPGRSLVGDSGILETEVVLISRKSYEEDVRWVYLDIGKFGGLAETMDEAIKYRLQVPGDGEGAEKGAVVLAGPTCDSADILYEKQQYKMPMSLRVGDKIRILSTGAYTTSYSAVNFNGFAPLKAYYI
jgi:ornithine decarboxylase